MPVSMGSQDYREERMPGTEKDGVLSVRQRKGEGDND